MGDDKRGDLGRLLHRRIDIRRELDEKERQILRSYIDLDRVVTKRLNKSHDLRGQKHIGRVGPSH